MPPDPERDGDVRFDGGGPVALFEEDQQPLLDHGVGPVGEQREGGVPEVVQDVVVAGAVRHVAALARIPLVVIADRWQGSPQGFGVDFGQRCRAVPRTRSCRLCGGVLHGWNLP